jgi:hypothetical protein
VWGNVARELVGQFGPCWLASEIAIIGASSEELRTGGAITPGAPAFGPLADFGSMIVEVRAHSLDSDWWTHQASFTTTDLETHVCV